MHTKNREKTEIFYPNQSQKITVSTQLTKIPSSYFSLKN
ncbi:hypothetical protein CP_1128 [Chlamydia pneumoniae AR39]|uniref:Uncharacterized protein n=1 Tax=Chlamydia pneumoniae TaxID=83558 RepID=Q9K1R9_CHLPN|nr:hypothetical protein CP_1128 [Chlamydia pneumoniae AR39]